MEAVKGLRLPTTYVEVSDNEMEYLDGGIGPATIGALAAVVVILVGGYCVLSQTEIAQTGPCSPGTIGGFGGGSFGPGTINIAYYFK